MSKKKLVPLVSGDAERKFGVQHAQNILNYQIKKGLTGKSHWQLKPESGFIFENNELKFKRNS